MVICRQVEFAKCGTDLDGRSPLYGGERGLGRMEGVGFVGVLSLPSCYHL